MSDVFHLWTMLRIPSIYYGPGLLSRCHVVDEWIDVDDIVAAARVYALTARNAVAPSLPSATVLDAIDADRVLRLAADLVRFPSVNPPGEEHEISEFIAGYLASRGIPVRRADSPTGRPNLIAELGAPGARPVLLFNGHSDVVPPGDGWSFDPFGGVVRDGRLHGRGAADMKAGLAAILEVATVFADRAAVLEGRLVWTIVSDEEAGGDHGTGFLCRTRAFQADMAIVAEPSEFRLSMAEGSMIWFSFVARGRSEHTINRVRAVNAVESMMLVANELLSIRDEVADRVHPTLGRPILSINHIDGGVKTNIVPDHCSMEVDFRFPPDVGLDIDPVLRDIEGRLTDLRSRHDGFDVTFTAQTKRGFSQPTDVAIVRHLLGAHQEVFGVPATWWRRGD
jgi:acetylornithine deacetylase/succinyl-diaminopimelate desuccinylase-like protein